MRSLGTRTAAIAVAVATIGLGLPACGGSGSGSGSSTGGGGDIVIGGPVPVSGDYASAGEDILHGAQLSVKKINDAGGVTVMKITIVSQDDACSAQTAAQEGCEAGRLIMFEVVEACISAGQPQ